MLNLKPFVLSVPEWQTNAACANLDTEMFVSFALSNQTKKAKEVCEGCPVKQKCLEWILGIERIEGVCPGVYGGLTHTERIPLRVCAIEDCTEKVSTGKSKHCKDHAGTWQSKYNKLAESSTYDYPYKGTVRN